MCLEHVLDGMFNVVNKKCTHPGCSKRLSYGIAGSNKAETCMKHAAVGMIHVKSKRCGHPICSKRYGRQQKG